MAMGGLVGLGTRGQLGAGRRQAGRAGGAGLGYSLAETAQQARAVGRATGSIGAVYRAQQFSRAYGMDVGEVSGYMGMLRQAGYEFTPEQRASRFTKYGPGERGRSRFRATGPSELAAKVGMNVPGVGVRRDTGYTQYGRRTKEEGGGARELQKIMAAGMASGIEKARLPEFMKGVTSMTSMIAARTSGKVDVQSLAAFQSMLGRSGYAGFQGARGAQVATQLLQATRAPGGGEAGQAMMLQALGFGKPGGGTSYYEALKRQQTGGAENVTAMFKEVYGQLGNIGAGGGAAVNQEANLALSEMTGLGLDQVEKLADIYSSNKGVDEKMAAVQKLMEDSEPIEKQSLKEMKKGFGDVVKQVASMQDEMAALGAEVAPLMRAMQKLQREALKTMIKWLPELVMWVKEMLVNLQGLAYGVMEKFGGKPLEKFTKITKQMREDMAKFDKDAVSGGTLAQRIVALNEQRRISQEGWQKLVGERVEAESPTSWIKNPLQKVASVFGGRKVTKQMTSAAAQTNVQKAQRLQAVHQMKSLMDQYAPTLGGSIATLKKHDTKTAAMVEAQLSGTRTHTMDELVNALKAINRKVGIEKGWIPEPSEEDKKKDKGTGPLAVNINSVSGEARGLFGGGSRTGITGAA
jgi:hypothetical protein